MKIQKILILKKRILEIRIGDNPQECFNFHEKLNKIIFGIFLQIIFLPIN